MTGPGRTMGAVEIEAGGGTRTHRCPWPDCVRQVPRDRFACNQHWKALPFEHRDAILSAWRAGRRQDHALAMGEAIRWMNGARTPTSLPDAGVRGTQMPPPRRYGTAAHPSVCSCGARMRWAETTNGKPIPLDYEPHERGNVVLEPREGRSPLAVVVGPPKPPPAQLDLLAPAPVQEHDLRTRYMPHHATCPDVSRFRS